MSLTKRIFESAVSRALRPLGYELRDRVLSERPEGFPAYLADAQAARMDVNDYEEQRLGWRPPLPTLEATIFPFLREDSKVCEIGPGTGRYTRHILQRIPRGEMHLVDLSPWMVRFLTDYFGGDTRVRAVANDGLSLPFDVDAWLDVIFVAATLVSTKLGVVYLYAREFARTLKPGGILAFDYVDPTTEYGWKYLHTQAPSLAGVFAFHSGPVINRVFEEAGFDILSRHPEGKATFVVMRRRG